VAGKLRAARAGKTLFSPVLPRLLLSDVL